MRNKKGQFKKGGISLMKGKKHSEEAIEKNRLAHLGKIAWNKGLLGFRKGHAPTNTKPNKTSFEKGEHPSVSTEFKKGVNKGELAYNWKGGKSKCMDCGKLLSTYIGKRCRKCRDAFNTGENNASWRGGISENLYPKEFNKALKLEIRTRDNFTCCLCGRTEREELEELNRVLCVNHIDFNKDNCKEDNLNTLCLRCNVKINREREYWTNYFKQQ